LGVAWRGEAQRTYLLRVQPGDVDLGKLVEFEEVLEEVDAGMDLGLAHAAINRIAAAAPRYGPTLTSLGFGGASASAAVFFGGRWLEVACSAAIGIIMVQIARVTGRRSATARVFEPTAACAAAFLSMLLAVPF
jgi:uncharacterized membrane protein YjjP (DUF1212 family)